MTTTEFVLATALFVAGILITYLWCLAREERKEREFWYESSGRAWESLFAHFGLEEEDVD